MPVIKPGAGLSAIGEALSMPGGAGNNKGMDVEVEV